MTKKKIVWICNFSNSEIRNIMDKKINPLEPLLYRIIHRKFDMDSDMGVWITNGILEVKRRKDIDLYVITLQRDLKKKTQIVTKDGINYLFIRDENSGLIRKIFRYLFTKNSSLFLQNRRRIRKVIETIQPDIVHIIGAENPFYSLSLLDVPKSVPTILQLQALLISLLDKVYGKEAVNFAYKGEIEKKLIQNADYVGTCVESFIDFIRKEIKPEVRIVNMTLPMAQTIDLSETPKEFTFVHYAGELRPTKATDVAVKAFAKVYERHPDITLDLIGAYSDDFKYYLDEIIEKAEIKGAVKFEGRLATHDHVIAQIRKAKFALLPIKTDIIPNTIHEAMANGLPVITTITEDGTIRLNQKRQSVLLSPIGDELELAKNIEFMLNNPDKAEELRQNAVLTEKEFSDNEGVVNRWIEIYDAIIKEKRYGIEIPDELML